jgi:hypothetical protein
MSSDHWVSVFSTVISFAGLLLVALQIRDSTKQRESDSLVELYDINRQLLSLGFSHPVLLQILEDKKTTDPLMEKRYLQLWLNQLSLSFAYLQRSVAQPELRESLERNLVDFMTMENMRRQWQQYGSFYPASFQKSVNEILEKMEPPATTAQVKSK